MNLQNRKVDAIDYYEGKLRKLDDQVIEARKMEHKATPVAFVTMDSIPACQLAVQVSESCICSHNAVPRTPQDIVSKEFLAPETPPMEVF